MYYFISDSIFFYFSNFFSIRDPIRDPIRSLIHDPVRKLIRDPIRDLIREPVRDPIQFAQKEPLLAHEISKREYICTVALTSSYCRYVF